MTPDDWFRLLRERLGETTPAVPSAPHATGGEVDALLDLARLAAHSSERWTAPVSGYLAGIALAGVDPAERADRLRALADALEADDATTS